MTEQGPRWLFRYADDTATEVSELLGKPPPVRPVVPVRLTHLGQVTLRAIALVDSGSERVFAAPSMARQLRLDLSGAPEAHIGLGGERRRVRFMYVGIQLFRDLLAGNDHPLTDWEADVAFLMDWEPPWALVLGRDGFFDKFTVTMHGGVPALVLEPSGAFDERFGVEIAAAPKISRVFGAEVAWQQPPGVRDPCAIRARSRGQ